MAETETYEALIKQIADALTRRANADLRQLRLTMPQANALLALSRLPGRATSYKDMEKRIRMAQSTTAGLIARLERKKLVASFVDSADRRVKGVRLTTAGARRCAAAARKMRQTQELLLSGLTEVERILLRELLKKVRAALDEAAPAEPESQSDSGSESNVSH